MRLALLVLAGIVCSSAASARDPDGRFAGSVNAPWFKTQHNALGEWCCDESDGHPYFGGYSPNVDGSVTLDGGRVIPREKVLTGPNPTGHAVYWFRDLESGRRDYCFAPGGGV